MSEGPAWFSWFSFPFFAPLSGSVSQEIAPYPYQGVPEIEADVTRNVASFGRQLGIISEAVLELAARLEAREPGEGRLAVTGDGSPDAPTPLDTLRALVAEVDAIKDRHREAVERDALRALERLKRMDAAGPDRLAARLRS